MARKPNTQPKYRNFVGGKIDDPTLDALLRETENTGSTITDIIRESLEKRYKTGAYAK